MPPCVPDTIQLVRVMIQVVTVIQVVGRISLDAIHSENEIAINLFRKSCQAGDKYTYKWLQRNKNSVWFWPGLHKLWQPCSQAARKWRENEEMKRKWRENEELKRD